MKAVHISHKTCARTVLGIGLLLLFAFVGAVSWDIPNIGINAQMLLLASALVCLIGGAFWLTIYSDNVDNTPWQS